MNMRETLQKVRDQFSVERSSTGGIAGISYADGALRTVITLLDAALAEPEAAAPSLSVAAEYYYAERVEKFTGEARWHGYVVGAYYTMRGKLRYVVDVEPQGFQMITVPDQIRKAPREENSTRMKPPLPSWLGPDTPENRARLDEYVKTGKMPPEEGDNQPDAAGARVRAEELDDDQIMEIIKEVAPWKDEPKLNDLLTYEKSPPLFPQATYDVPSYRATNFVRAVERRIRGSLSTQPQPAQADGWRGMPAPSLERVIVAGWEPRNGNTAGYWWYQEDAADDKGIPIDCPHATLWVRLLDILPAFPSAPTPAPAEGR